MKVIIVGAGAELRSLHAIRGGRGTSRPVLGAFLAGSVFGLVFRHPGGGSPAR